MTLTESHDVDAESRRWSFATTLYNTPRETATSGTNPLPERQIGSQDRKVSIKTLSGTTIHLGTRPSYGDDDARTYKVSLD